MADETPVVPGEQTIDMAMSEGTMEVGGIKTKGFRLYSIIMVVLIALILADLLSAWLNRDLTYVTPIKDIAIFVLGVFSGKKM